MKQDGKKYQKLIIIILSCRKNNSIAGKKNYYSWIIYTHIYKLFFHNENKILNLQFFRTFNEILFCHTNNTNTT